MNPLRWSYRTVYLSGFVICAALLGYALYAQYRLGLSPCPLCIFQRIAFVFMGVFFLIGGLHAPRGRARWIYTGLVLLGALWGLVVAIRHTYLQSLPPDAVPSCGPGLGYILDTFPLSKALKLVFTGSGECAAAHWHFLGLTMPAWTLIWFVVLGTWALWAALRRHA
jgi:disulfide bond formation protein DsbB